MVKRIDRRDVLLGLGAAGLATSFFRATPARAQEAGAEGPGEAADPPVGTGEKHVEYLFVQSAQSVRLSGGLLELRDVTSATVYFSDRPERIAGHVPTPSFVQQWGVGEDNFAGNPPNAALSVLGDEKIEEVVLTLRAPQLKSGNLSYRVDVLEGPTEVSGKAGSLFIDVIGRPMTPMSIAGHRRRVRRRVTR
jgi:hypothetical protein